MPDRLRVCLVVNDFPTLSETFIVRKAQSLVARGVEVTVFRNDAPTRHESRPIPQGVRVISRPRDIREIGGLMSGTLSRRTRRVRRAWASAVEQFGWGHRAARAWALAAPILATDSDVVHFEFSGIAVTYADTLSLLRPAELVVSCRGASEQIAPLVNPNRRVELSRVLPAFDRVHCVSDDMARTVSEFGVRPETIFVNRPAVSMEEFAWRVLRPKHEAFRIVSVGRFHWKKSLETLIQAASILRREGVTFRLQLAGSGPEEEKLRYMVGSLRLTEHITFLGPLAPIEVRQLLEDADAFVLCSISEGLSNAVLEAMAVGVPVVSTDVGGMDEVLCDGRNGLLIPPLDPSALAGALRRLVTEEQLGPRLARHARATVTAHFDLHRQADVFVSEYRRLVASSNFATSDLPVADPRERGHLINPNP